MICSRCKKEAPMHHFFTKMCIQCVHETHTDPHKEREAIHPGVDISPDFIPYPIKDREALEKGLEGMWKNPKMTLFQDEDEIRNKQQKPSYVPENFN